MNKKGQALIEFILILPIFIMLVFIIVDFGTIFSSKAKLENESYDIVELIGNNTSIEEVRNLYENLEINISIKNNYQTVYISEEVKLITPGIYRILDNPFNIEIERIIPYET